MKKKEPISLLQFLQIKSGFRPKAVVFAVVGLRVLSKKYVSFLRAAKKCGNMVAIGICPGWNHAFQKNIEFLSYCSCVDSILELDQLGIYRAIEEIKPSFLVVSGYSENGDINAIQIKETFQGIPNMEIVVL